jgi:hypothetical protein
MMTESFFRRRVRSSAGFAGRLREPLAEKTFRKKLVLGSGEPA